MTEREIQQGIEAPFFIYGSENPKARGKAHICDNNARVLCGAKIKFGEATGQLEYADGKFYSAPFAVNRNILKMEHVFYWNEIKCAKCESSFLNWYNTHSK